jgi:hypothetical protein
VDDVVLTKGEAEIKILPIGPAYIETQKQFAQIIVWACAAT